MNPRIMAAAQARRSIRSFDQRPVEPGHIETILEAGRRAPSAVNLQPARVIVATSAADLAEVRSAAYGVGACVTAPCVLVCMTDLDASTRVGERIAELNECGALEPMNPTALVSGADRPFELKVGRDVALLNCAVAVAHMDLQATELELGTCWVHHADFEQLREHFSLPGNIEIVTLLAVGHPAERPEPRPRIPSIDWADPTHREDGPASETDTSQP